MRASRPRKCVDAYEFKQRERDAKEARVNALVATITTHRQQFVKQQTTLAQNVVRRKCYSTFCRKAEKLPDEYQCYRYEFFENIS